ncbi:LOW QUALITY PROTEIN: DNA topoisomerase I, mitochondrial-like [Ruditapes philippinarum]|uniref:LOW QUALITY PROTEIN: DNA topoisomerase I, mitochondrial-like n=1 Tax=Ruditapes philippinarum TaxID=129788 RepID=UPI00295B2531|nr:LOW QUALITY PROTEIN: DNA topoisomerase I, mitochondrial-like [Ruditapes philippinarum]
MAEIEVERASGSANGAGDSMDSTESGMNGDILNHIDQNKQNGYPESGNEGQAKEESSKSKDHRDKDREKSKHSSSSDKHKSSSSGSADKHKHSSSSSSSKHHSSSSSSSKHRDGHSSSSHKHGSSSSSSKHRDGHSSSKDKHSSSSSHSSSKDKDRHGSSDKSKHSSSSSSKHSSSDKHRDKDREHKSKSSSGDSSSKSSSDSKSKKENVDVDKEKERQERKEKERQERKEKERQERKEKERQERKERERQERKEKERLEREQNEESVEVKSEPVSPVKSESRSPRKASPTKSMKEEPESDEDDIPLSVRLKQEQVEKPIKREREDSDDDDVPLSARMEQVKKVKKEKKESPPSGKKRKAEESDDEKPLKKKKKAKQPVKQETTSPTKKKGKGAQQEGQEVWKWWEEEKGDSDEKWRFLEHKGPVFAPLYERMPKDVKFYYNGEPMLLSEEAEEVATFYAKMLEHDYTSKEVFNTNFFKDWRKVMTTEEREKLKDLKKCNFREMCEYFKEESEKRKNRSKEEKLKLKEENARMQEEYGFCTMDGHKEKIGNFRIEPPGLFRGRGDHPKQGMLKRRVQPEDVIINCSKDSKIPEPPKGHKWKRVQFDNKVTWLASWNENIQNQIKYVMLNASSRLKGEKDWQKYETARRLHKCVDKIRANYQEDWKSKEMRIRQRAVAMYFIDKLALRAGNEKEEGETADTVGCCSLRVEHITLHIEKDGKQNVVEFDFLGKDSIRYQNAVPVEKRVFKNLQMFMDNKQPGDDLFDRLNTSILNKHLHDLMEGLTAKVFRTYNASKTLQEQLDLMTNEEDPVPAKMLSYNRANRAVAILCNHQRAAPKNFSKQMKNIMAKIKDKRAVVKEAKKALKEAKAAFKSQKNQKNKLMYEKKKKAYERSEEQLTKLEVQATDKDENKEIALGTSKLNYLDPRISVAWCKKWEVPIEKVYNKTQRDKFRWAIDMAGADFRF